MQSYEWKKHYEWFNSTKTVVENGILFTHLKFCFYVTQILFINIFLQFYIIFLIKNDLFLCVKSAYYSAAIHVTITYKKLYL